MMYGEMVDSDSWEHSHEKQVTEWSATMWGLATAYYLMGIAFGLVGLLVGVDHLWYPTTGLTRGPAVLFVLVGIWFLGICLGSILYTAKTVGLTPSGDLVFASRQRELLVLPGQLYSVDAMPLDWNRLLPWKVRAMQGSIWLWPRFSDMDELWKAFLANSPAAEIDRPFPLAPWRSGTD